MGTDAAHAAVANNTPDGQVINYDGKAPQGDFRRWAALKTVQASDTFRSIWGDAAMGDRVRVVLEYQYDNEQDTAVGALQFMGNFFNNADGVKHVPNPKPVSYYIWGAGGASYFGASNPRGLVDDISSYLMAVSRGRRSRPVRASRRHREVLGHSVATRACIATCPASKTTHASRWPMWLRSDDSIRSPGHVPVRDGNRGREY